MHTMTVLIGATFALFATGPAHGRTFKDVKQCLKENMASMLKTCEVTLPWKPADFRKCVDAATTEGFQKPMATCLKQKGITDDSSCKHFVDPNAPTGADFEQNMFARVPDEIIQKLGPFLNCAASVYKDQDDYDCTKGCENADLKTVAEVVDCMLAARPKPGERNEFMECIKKIAA